VCVCSTSLLSESRPLPSGLVANGGVAFSPLSRNKLRGSITLYVNFSHTHQSMGCVMDGGDEEEDEEEEEEDDDDDDEAEDEDDGCLANNLGDASSSARAALGRIT
jgi:hypothetical protein